MNGYDLSARARTAARKFSLRLLTIAACGCGLLLAACGGGGSMGSSSSGSNTGSTDGVAMITLTDQPGDFLTYMVNVTSLSLTAADGTVVQTVPATTSVDFAQLVDLSEVISAQQVPSGAYTSVTLTLDYTNANIVVDNGTTAGLTVLANNIINGQSNAPLVGAASSMPLTLQLPSGAPLIVNNGTVANLALDFNLTASDTVAPATIDSSTAASAVTVTVNPVLVASLTPDTSKQIRVRGGLVSVTNTASQTSYTVTVCPFFAAAGSNMGQVVVYTTSTTSFTLNGTTSTGSAGLTALAALPAGTLTVAYGTFDTTSSTFTAAEVFAGTSVPGAGLDSAQGTVIARSGNTLTLDNAFLQPRAGGDVSGGMVAAQAIGAWNMGGGFGFGHFNGQLSVTVGSATTVTELGQTGSFTAQDISVGQHVQVFGTFSGAAGSAPTLDATAGSVLLTITPLWGEYTSTAGNVVTLNLEALDGREPSVFNFAGTGTSSANDATASAYTVSVPAALAIPTLTAGFPIEFTGFVTPFGSAPPDFAALSLVNYTATNARLHAAWSSPGLTAPFVAPLSATNVVISQATLESAAFEVVRIGPAQFNPASLSSGLAFVPSSSASATFSGFVITHSSSWQFQVYSTFGDFISALSGDLNGTTALFAVDAVGPYDETTGVLTPNVMAVALSD